MAPGAANRNMIESTTRGLAEAELTTRTNGLSCRLSLSRSFALKGERSPALLGGARGDRGLVSESEPSPRKMQRHRGHRDGGENGSRADEAGMFLGRHGPVTGVTLDWRNITQELHK